MSVSGLVSITGLITLRRLPCLFTISVCTSLAPSLSFRVELDSLSSIAIPDLTVCRLSYGRLDCGGGVQRS